MEIFFFFSHWDDPDKSLPLAKHPKYLHEVFVVLKISKADTHTHTRKQKKMEKESVEKDKS